MKFIKGKNLLWLWILPAALSWLLIVALKPTGRATIWTELAVTSICSFACGFGLASRIFKTSKQRFLGGLYFTGSSLCLIFSVAFLGCLSIPQRQLTPAQMEQQRVQQEARMKALVASRVTPRDASADITMLDLSPFYDAPLNFQNSARVRSITTGTHVWNGIKFDVRAKIQLAWNQQGLKGIPVGQKCSDLYFLHGVEWGMPSNTVSKFVIHLAGTNTETIPMVFGRDVACEFLGMKNKLGVTPTNLIVWQERILTNAPPQPWRGFFVSRWVNPFPDQPVQAVDFESEGQNGSGAFLVAITVKPIESENK
jgi:hypothetical protein